MSDLSTRSRLAGAINTGAIHRGTSKHRRRSATLEQGQARRSEDSLQAQGAVRHNALRYSTQRAAMARRPCAANGERIELID